MRFLLFFGVWLVWQSAGIRLRFQNQLDLMARHVIRSIGGPLVRIIFTVIAVAEGMQTVGARVQILEKIAISQP